MDVTRRFDGRADDYDRARPGYPAEAVDWIRERAGLGVHDRVVDLGAGTGLFADGFVARGDRVTLVEPNADMAALARTRFAGAADVVEARAEATTLPDACAALVTAAQAFHWFAPAPTAREVRRLLRPGGSVALVWNHRRLSGDAFLEAYEAFLAAWGTDYAKVAARYEDEADMKVVFGGELPAPARFENRQALDRAGLRARILSCSYIPKSGDPRFEAMGEAIERLYDAHAGADGLVTLVYDTTVYQAAVAA